MTDHSLANPGALTDREALFDQIADALERDGLVILDNAVPTLLCEALMAELERRDLTAFHEAGVGRGAAARSNQRVRRDRIDWIDDRSSAGRAWLDWSGALRDALNRRLFLGLSAFESHFAIYRPGDFYARHSDAFAGARNRVLSLVTYLNRDWQAGDGGELVIWDPTGNELARVLPRLGCLVVFLSEVFPHEVLPARRERHSIAGWFRVRSNTPI